ncbi:phage antirepressor KilAC domain-containing protein [Terrisporobacter glycolicus]|nr:phage antirepressor KilAC domain-containing protein [Terrisporobacter glycolicus]
MPSYRVGNYNSENFSDLLTNFRDTAKMFGMKENMLISWLILRNFCYRENYNSIRPYSQYMKYFNLRPFKSPAGHSGIQSLVNARGRDYFTNLLMNENLMEVEYISVL